MRKGAINKDEYFQGVLREIDTKEVISQNLTIISTKVGIPKRSLRRHAPSLCKEIAQKNIKYEASIAAQNEMALSKIAYNSAFELLRLGKKPNSTNIGPYLPHGAYLLSPAIREAIKQAINDFANLDLFK